MSPQNLIIILFVCGLAAMFVEMFLPGAIIGSLGFLAVAGSIAYAFVTGHTTTGAILLACLVAFLPIFFLVWKNVLGRFFAIQGDERDFRSSTTVNKDLVDSEGIAVTPLHPSGIARINDRRYDVVTRGEMLEKGARIKVVEVAGNRVVVTRI